MYNDKEKLDFSLNRGRHLFYTVIELNPQGVPAYVSARVPMRPQKNKKRQKTTALLTHFYPDGSTNPPGVVININRD